MLLASTAYTFFAPAWAQKQLRIPVPAPTSSTTLITNILFHFSTLTVSKITISCTNNNNRHIFEVLACKVHRRSFGCIFPIYVSKNKAACREVQTHFFKRFLLVRLMKKFWPHFHDLCRTNKHSWLKDFVKMFLGTLSFTILHINFSVLLGHTEKFLTFTFYKNALNLNTFGLHVHPQIVTHGCDFMWSTFKQVLDWHLRHVL